MSDTNTQPHDKLFKEVFGDKQYAVSHFRTFLPAPLVAALDMDNAERRLGSFIDEELRGHHSDLLYEIPWLDDESCLKTDRSRPAVFCYLLFEHQRCEDAEMPLRMLAYSLRIWKTWLKDNKITAGLPVIVPLVLYHDSHTWRARVRFQDYFTIPNGLDEVLRPHIPQYQMLLTDLSRYSDEELRQGTLDALALILFKHIHSDPEALLEHINHHFDLVEKTLAAPSGFKSVTMVLEYLLKTSDIPEVEIVRLSRRLGAKVEEEIMTTAERLRDEGWKKGRQKGRQEGRQEGRLTGQRQLVMRLLRLKFGDSADHRQQEIEHMGIDELDKVAAGVLTAESLDELFK